jgi:acyl carrier protein
MGLFDKFFGRTAPAPVQQRPHSAAPLTIDPQREAPAAVVRKVLANIIREEKGWQPTPAQCGPSVRFVKDLGLDNLDIVDLAMRLEEFYGEIALPDWSGDDMMKLSLGEFIMAVERHCASQRQ